MGAVREHSHTKATRSACHENCYVGKHADMPWDGKKCNWKRCKACTECSASMPQGEARINRDVKAHAKKESADGAHPKKESTVVKKADKDVKVSEVAGDDSQGFGKRFGKLGQEIH